MVVEVRLAGEAGEPHEDVLAGAYRQRGWSRWKIVISMRAGPAEALPAAGRPAGGAGKPERAVTGRSSSTLSLSIMVALAWVR